MATATAQGAPTEAEIREAVYAVQPNAPEDHVGNLVYELCLPLRYLAPAEDQWLNKACLWDDLRPSEAARLDDLLEDVYEKVDVVIKQDVMNRIREIVVDAMLAFAKEYPEARRRTREAVVTDDAEPVSA